MNNQENKNSENIKEAISFKDKSVLVYDSGLFTFIAERLTRDFGKVYYYSPWKSAFNRSSALAIGYGIENVERVFDFWEYIDDVDLFVFPDVISGDLQLYLRSIGKRVFGGGKSDDFEFNRWLFRYEQKQHNMKVPKTRFIQGIDELKEYLSHNDDVYVKINYYRGDLETYHHHNYKLSEPFLIDLEYRLGGMKNEVEFVVEDKIPSDVEVGYDGFCIDGKFPDVGIYGYEVKDKSYVGKVSKYSEMPECIKETNKGLSEIVKDYGIRGFYSSEIKVLNNGSGVFLDPALRAGSPPSEAYIEVYENLAEILWYGAEGKIVTPKTSVKYCAIALIHSKYADTRWMAITIPEKYRQWVKIKNLNINSKGEMFSVPTNNELYAIGGVVGVGNSIEECFDMINTIAETIQGYDIEIKLNSLEDAKEVIKKGEKIGIQF